MKKKLYFTFIILSIIFFSSCGTISSIEAQSTYIQYATVKISPTVNVSGRLVKLNDSMIAITVDGVYVEYDSNNIIGYSLYKMADPDLMQINLLKNTKTIASNTGFFVGLTTISAIITVLILLSGLQ